MTSSPKRWTARWTDLPSFLLLRRREALLAQSPSSAVGGQGMPFLGAPHYSLSPFAGDACALNAAVRENIPLCR